MSESWDSALSQMLSMLVFGYSYHEIVYKIREGDSDNPQRKSKFNDGRIGWRKMPIRAQETLFRWMMDDDGGIQGMVQVDPSSGGIHNIPIEKALLFCTLLHYGYSLHGYACQPRLSVYQPVRPTHTMT